MKVLRHQLFETATDLQSFANINILKVSSKEIVNITVTHGVLGSDWFTLWWIEKTADGNM
jgi:hypothetical protein